jgi:hypothetical protein
MLGRVYTFERDFTIDVPPDSQSISSAALSAIVAASTQLGGIRHEELTEDDNSRPIVAMLFSDAARMPQFDALITAALAPRAIRVNVAHAGDVSRVTDNTQASPQPMLAT